MRQVAEPPTSVAMLHGFTGSGLSFEPLIEHLPPDWSLHCPDLVGHGEASDVVVADFDAEVERVASGILHASPGRWHLLGYSMGARVALGMLARDPQRFASAVLIGVHPGLESSAERTTRLAADERWARMLEEQGIEPFLDSWSQLQLFASQKSLPPAALAAQQRIRSSHSPSGLAAAMRTLSLGRMPNQRLGLDRLAARNAPPSVTLVAGSLDSKFLALGRSLVGRLSSSKVCARLEIVEGAGHNVLLEAPQAVAGFLCRAVAESELSRAAALEEAMT